MNATMKAIVCHRYGSPDLLTLEDVPVPALKDDEVLIQTRAASVNSADWRVVTATPFLVRLMFGLFKPRFSSVGMDVAGTIAATGAKVSEWKVGDEVVGDVFNTGFGAFAEYTRCRAADLVRKPANLSWEEAAALPLAGVTAVQAVRYGAGVQPGQDVLVHGASGGVGTYIVQLAKALGARVTAVTRTASMDLARAIGAERVLDYTREDFAKDAARYDWVFVCGGNRSIFDYRRVLKPTGTSLLCGGEMRQLYQMMLLGGLLSRTSGGRRLANLVAKTNAKDLGWLCEFAANGKVRAVIDRTFPLRETPAAIRYVEEGKACGKVAITV